jgi:hypothetical protein
LYPCCPSITKYLVFGTGFIDGNRIPKKSLKYQREVIRICISKKNRQHNGQNCSILSQKVPKFELYKHNDELFNIYYGIFYELSDTILKGDHLRIISAKLVEIGSVVSEEKIFF